MRVMGVDPGTLQMGYGVVEEAGGAVMALGWGVLTARRGLALGERLHLLHRQLLALLERWSPTEIAVEEPFVARNVPAAMAVGQAQGVALMAAAARGIPVARYSPARVKNAVTGYGGSGKMQVQEAVRLYLGLDLPPDPEDAADGLAVALCHLQARVAASLSSGKK
ncbi:MAG: crossover junction endodeoxyribonuclease RuvC [Chloroflexi bacterium]|nr:crossover junction endodeoxyribonuclease RuvC [Chloroflexota bacterium]